MAFSFLSQSGTFLLSLPSSSSLPVESSPVSPSTYIVSCTVPYFGRSSKFRRCAFAAFYVERTSTCTIFSQHNSHAVSIQDSSHLCFLLGLLGDGSMGFSHEGAYAEGNRQKVQFVVFETL
jgi:hypothetical protein